MNEEDRADYLNTIKIYKQIVAHLKAARTMNREHFDLTWGNEILDLQLTEIIDHWEEFITDWQKELE